MKNLSPEFLYSDNISSAALGWIPWENGPPHTSRPGTGGGAAGPPGIQMLVTRSISETQNILKPTHFVETVRSPLGSRTLQVKCPAALSSPAGLGG